MPPPQRSLLQSSNPNPPASVTFTSPCCFIYSTYRYLKCSRLFPWLSCVFLQQNVSSIRTGTLSGLLPESPWHRMVSAHSRHLIQLLNKLFRANRSNNNVKVRVAEWREFEEWQLWEQLYSQRPGYLYIAKVAIKKGVQIPRLGKRARHVSHHSYQVQAKLYFKVVLMTRWSQPQISCPILYHQTLLVHGPLPFTAASAGPDTPCLFHLYLGATGLCPMSLLANPMDS